MTGYPRQYGKYVLLEPIGAGGMSEVDLARRGVEETSFVRFVAIKRVARTNLTDEAYVRMFMDEARINAELHHGNIVQVFDFGKLVDPTAGREEYFMVMEYVPGLDLRAIQRAAQARGTGLPLRFCLSVLCEVLNGLQYAHTKVDTLGRPMNLVHRDINPRNVMVSVSGEVKVIDFGVALAEDRLEKTQGRSLKGKFAYMSPEQIEGNVVLDGRTDLYAVGLMLHELVEGQGPFQGLTELQIMHRIVMGQVPDLQAVGGFPRPDLLRRVHARAIARDRDRRYPDAATFRRDLEALADQVAGPSSQEERATLVRSLAPVEVDGIGDRLRQYHEHSQSVSRSFARGALPVAPDRSGSDLSLPPTADATASLGGETQELSAGSIERPGGSLTRLWVVVAAVLGLGILFLLGLGVGVAWWMRRTDLESAAAPPTVETSPGGEAVAPGVPTDPTPAPATVPPAQPGSAAAGTPRVVTRPEPSPTGPRPGPRGADRAADPAVGEAGTPPEPPEAPAPAPEPPPVEPPAPAPGQAASTEPTPTPPAPAPGTEVPPAPTTIGPMGRLMVTSEVPGQVVVNGKVLGSTPLNIPFPQGTYTVVVMGAAGELCRQQATVSSRLAPVLCRGAGKAGEQRDDDDQHQR